MLQHLTEPSTPPEKQKSPRAETQRLRTGPVWPLNVYTGSTSSCVDFLEVIVFCKFHIFKVWSSLAVISTGSEG